MSRRGQRQPKTYWRCPRCRTLTPTKYHVCATCGHDRTAVLTGNEIIEAAKLIFPGSYEP